MKIETKKNNFQQNSILSISSFDEQDEEDQEVAEVDAIQVSCKEEQKINFFNRLDSANESFDF